MPKPHIHPLLPAALTLSPPLWSTTANSSYMMTATPTAIACSDADNNALQEQELSVFARMLLPDYEPSLIYSEASWT